jgi:hypothetical protein
MQKVPEQIKKQSAQVQALYEEMGQAANAADGAQPTGESKGASAEGKPELSVVSDGQSNVVSGRTTEQPRGKEDDYEALQHRYRTLQGMFNAEVPRLRAEKQELSGRLQSLEELVASLSVSKGSAGSGSVAADEFGSTLVTEEDVQEYGASIDVMRRVSREELSPVMQQLVALERAVMSMQSEVVPTVKTMVADQTNSKTARFVNTLTQEVPDWRTINDDPDFHTWLYQTDLATGETRQSLLADAQSKLDAKRAVYFFKTWIGESGYSGSTAEDPHDVNAELARQTAPAKRGGGGGRPTQAKQKTYTRVEVAAFYDDVRKGLYRGREEEKARLESDIFAAQQEGRIVN